MNASRTGRPDRPKSIATVPNIRSERCRCRGNERALAAPRRSSTPRGSSEHIASLWSHRWSQAAGRARSRLPAAPPLLENAAQIHPDRRAFRSTRRSRRDGLTMTVAITARYRARRYRTIKRFYRGADASTQRSGTGMGPTDRARRAGPGGRRSAENCAGGGARFTIVAAEVK